MAEIKWIKITTDIFDDEKIKIIEKMPEGDTMLVIWLKLLTLAGKKNDHGFVYFTKEIPYTPEILSDIFGRESRLISLALNTFCSFGMIEIEKDIISVLNWDRHQNIEGMDKIREQNRIRQANYRERKQLPDSNVISRDSNGTDKIRLDKEEDKNKSKKEKQPKHKHGEYSHVLLTDEQFLKLESDWGIEELERMIQKLDEGIEEKGYKYKNHNLTLRKWKSNDKSKTDIVQTKLTEEERSVWN